MLFRLVSAQADPSEHHVVSLGDMGFYGERLRVIGVRVTALNMVRARDVLPCLMRLIRLLRADRPDVVQTWMYHADLLGGIAAAFAGIPVCWGIRHSDLSERMKFTTRLVARICAALSRKIPSLIISCSRRAAKAHSDFGYKGRFTVIPNGLDIDEFVVPRCRGDALREKLGIPVEAPVIGHVGRGHPDKGHEILLNVLHFLSKAMPNAHFVLAGEGLRAGAPYLLRLTRGHEPLRNLHLLGARNDIAEVLRAMDVFILSSWTEAFPNVLVEAMASGIPCVSTDAGDAEEVLGGTGWICPPGDVQSLVRAIELALSESRSDRSMRLSQARQRVRGCYSSERMVLSYSKAWASVCLGAT